MGRAGVSARASAARTAATASARPKIAASGVPCTVDGRLPAACTRQKLRSPSPFKCALPGLASKPPALAAQLVSSASTSPGAACCIRRAARITPPPMVVSWRLSAEPMGPSSTRPVAMPTRVPGTACANCTAHCMASRGRVAAAPTTRPKAICATSRCPSRPKLSNWPAWPSTTSWTSCAMVCSAARSGARSVAANTIVRVRNSCSHCAKLSDKRSRTKAGSKDAGSSAAAGSAVVDVGGTGGVGVGVGIAAALSVTTSPTTPGTALGTSCCARSTAAPPATSSKRPAWPPMQASATGPCTTTQRK